MWVKIVKAVDTFVRTTGIKSLALVITKAVGVSSGFLRSVVEYFLKRLWTKTVEPELDGVAFRLDNQVVQEELLHNDNVVYEEALTEFTESGVISDATRAKLEQADIDFLNGAIGKRRIHP